MAEVKLTRSAYYKTWQMNIYVDNPTGIIEITIEKPYRDSIDQWRKITGGNCALYMNCGLSLDDGHYQFESDTISSSFRIAIKEEVLRDKLSAAIDEAVQLGLPFLGDGCEDIDSDSDEE